MTTCTLLRQRYKQGLLPIARLDGDVVWRVASIHDIDAVSLIPVFLDGLTETRDPYRFFALQGSIDLCRIGGDSLADVVNAISAPLAKAVRSNDTNVVASAMAVFRELLMRSPRMAVALLPYMRHLLVPMAKHVRSRALPRLRRLVEETLSVMVSTGGDRVRAMIRDVIPTYPSH